VTGWPTLIDVFGAERTALVDRVHQWLDAVAKLTPAPAAPQSTTRNGNAADADGWELETRRLDGVQPAPVEFLVEGYVPLGKVTLLGGCGGMSKSTVTLEDDAQDTVVPRLLAAGADRTRIHEVVCKRNKTGKREPFSLGDCAVLAAPLPKRTMP
jgi:hypothetical protein